jgi:hypothetical protein
MCGRREAGGHLEVELLVSVARGHEHGHIHEARRLRPAVVLGQLHVVMHLGVVSLVQLLRKAIALFSLARYMVFDCKGVSWCPRRGWVSRQGPFHHLPYPLSLAKTVPRCGSTLGGCCAAVLQA